MLPNNPKISIIIPTYNENGNIESICKEIFYAIKKFSSEESLLINTSIIIVDDDSQDGTKETLEKISKKNKEIKIISRRNKTRSFSQSYIEGFRLALADNADYIIQMDADFSHNPKYLPQIIKELKNNSLVIGSRYTVHGKTVELSIFRELLSRFGNLFTRFASKIPINDLTSGFVGWRNSELKKINFDKIKTNGYAFQIEIKRIAFNNKATIKEVPIVFINRANGGSKMNLKIILEAIIFCWKLFFNITR